eukprot:TRINITY_DN4006_c4_g1_i1.p1 TRINITY_DN4006_c4_g1~~TRINITY_DN4006_c4_g1_i1.p1  ORF type:complete len:589 (+),score=63.33 TRINITY_DN4006_c4_g1_i1:106-1872(+)
MRAAAPAVDTARVAGAVSYLRRNRVAELLDVAIAALCAARPPCCSAWLAAHFAAWQPAPAPAAALPGPADAAQRAAALAYAREHNVAATVDAAVVGLAAEMPADPSSWLAAHFATRAAGPAAPPPTGAPVGGGERPVAGEAQPQRTADGREEGPPRPPDPEPGCGGAALEQPQQREQPRPVEQRGGDEKEQDCSPARTPPWEREWHQDFLEWVAADLARAVQPSASSPACCGLHPGYVEWVQRDLAEPPPRAERGRTTPPLEAVHLDFASWAQGAGAPPPGGGCWGEMHWEYLQWAQRELNPQALRDLSLQPRPPPEPPPPPSPSPPPVPDAHGAPPPVCRLPQPQPQPQPAVAAGELRRARAAAVASVLAWSPLSLAPPQLRRAWRRWLSCAALRRRSAPRAMAAAAAAPPPEAGPRAPSAEFDSPSTAEGGSPPAAPPPEPPVHRTPAVPPLRLGGLQASPRCHGENGATAASTGRSLSAGAPGSVLSPLRAALERGELGSARGAPWGSPGRSPAGGHRYDGQPPGGSWLPTPALPGAPPLAASGSQLDQLRWRRPLGSNFPVERHADAAQASLDGTPWWSPRTRE